MPAHRWQDPWPSPQVAWADPPWQLTGRVVTTWFDVPRAQVEQVLSPSLWPAEAPTVRARLRFYNIAFTALADTARAPWLASEGRFREAVIAFQASAGSLNGEVSLFMWTDSDPYLMWGREVFGWPLLRGRIDLAGPLWESQTLLGSRGTATLSVPDGSIALAIGDVTNEVKEKRAPPCWLTPRRVLHRAGLDDETRELLIVRPNVQNPGVHYTASGSVVLEFATTHPLHGLAVGDADYEVVDGIELVVGSDVDVM